MFLFLVILISYFVHPIYSQAVTLSFNIEQACGAEILSNLGELDGRAVLNSQLGHVNHL